LEAELDLRQTEDPVIAVRSDAIVEHHRNFEAAAKAHTVDRHDGRAGQVANAQEYALSELAESRDLGRRFEAAELVDVGAHDETAGFPGVHDEAGRWVRCQLPE
jgi:hypothetical protein